MPKQNVSQSNCRKAGPIKITLSVPVQQWYYFLDRLLKMPVYYWVGLVEWYRVYNLKLCNKYIYMTSVDVLSIKRISWPFQELLYLHHDGKIRPCFVLSCLVLYVSRFEMVSHSTVFLKGGFTIFYQLCCFYKHIFIQMVF